jgi:hypothetical protein
MKRRERNSCFGKREEKKRKICLEEEENEEKIFLEGEEGRG